MAEISDVRQLFFNVLKTFAEARSPALRIKIKGVEFTPADNETYLEFFLKTAKPSKPYAGYRAAHREMGFCQVNVIGPESRKQKAFEKIAWDVREAFWPTSAAVRPTLGSSPLVLLGETPPHVEDHPAPGEGRLGSTCTIYWHSDFLKS